MNEQADVAVKVTILVVDDDRAGRETLCEALREWGYEVTAASNGAEAVRLAEETPPDGVITDLKMPGLDGLDLLRKIKAMDARVFVILVTAYGAVETAVSAMKEGAYDYLTKPVDLRQVRALLERAVEARRLKLENVQLRRRLDEKYGFSNIIGRSAAMQAVFERIRTVVDRRVPVLIQGPSGTGKELVANALHNLSPRKNRPFIKVNCAALTETLLESELFGHEKGSFTGAIRQKKGRFELADGGTLFLDEISEMSAATQAKILRVLQEFEFERVGGTETLQVDVRLIAATNQELKRLVEDGRFREDLYYRLNVVPIHLPPLKDRQEDIPLLISAFLDRFTREHRKPIDEVAPEVMRALMAHDWPGNVRELQNVIENMVLMTKGRTLSLASLPEEVCSTRSEDGGDVPLGLSLDELERRAIRRTLALNDGNRRKTADLLGIPLRSLYRKLEHHGLK